MKQVQEFLLSEALNTVPRVLGFCDRTASSKTFGCCDRMYWHYQLIDFPNARFQEAGLLLALAYANKIDGNLFYNQQRVLEWVSGIWSYWASSRNRDGSVAELYPHERCFCATAFTAAAYVDTVALLANEAATLPSLDAVETTMHWLATNQNMEVFNQMAGSYHALLGYAHLTGDTSHHAWAEKRYDDIKLLILDDGIFPEYGGFDAGYQSISLSALAGARRFSESPNDLDEIIQRGKSCMYDMVNPERKQGSPTNSRNTQYIYPFTLFDDAHPSAEYIQAEIASGGLLRPTWMDDRYCIALAIDFFRAGLPGLHS